MPSPIENERVNERITQYIHSSGPTIVIASVTPTPKILVTQSVLLAALTTNEEVVDGTLLVAPHVSPNTPHAASRL